MSTGIVIIDIIIYLDIIIYGAFREKWQGGKKVRQEEYTLNGPGESISWKAKLLKKFVKTWKESLTYQLTLSSPRTSTAAPRPSHPQST